MNKNPLFGSPAYDPLKNFVSQPSRPVVSLFSPDPNAGGPQGNAVFTIQRAGGTLASPLTVYYAVGGDAVYGTDYTLTPAPPEYPRIFSAIIPANQTTVSVTLSPAALKATGVGSQTVVVKLTPYSVSTTTQVSDPAQWEYVVNVFQDTVTLNLYNILPGLNGPVYAIKMYKTVVYINDTCSEYQQLIVGGQFTQAGATAVNNIARWNSITGDWEPLGGGVNGPVYAIEAVERFPGDTNPDIYAGGNFTAPARAIAKWNGATATWSAVGTGLNSQAFLQPGLVRVNALRKVGGNLWVGGRFSTAGAVTSPNIAKWNLATSQWGPIAGGLNSPVIMVTSIDRSGTSLGVAASGVLCPYCPAGIVHREAFYTVEDSGGSQILHPTGRSINLAGVRAVDQGIAGHDQLSVAPWNPATLEAWELNYSGLSELAGTWQLLGFSGAALPPAGGSLWWPASGVSSGWKSIGAINAITRYGSEVYLGGSFNTLSGANPGMHVADYGPFNNVFKWNTIFRSWSALANPSGVPCVVPGAGGVNGPVFALEEEHSLCNGTFTGVWVGGNFSQAGGGSAWNIGFWTNDVSNPQNPRTYWAVPATPTIIIPGNGASVSSPVLVLADFAAAGCAIAKVEFFEENRLLASITSSPYSFTWNGVSAGMHTIRAVATDGNGRIAISEPVSFTVQ